MSITQRSGKKTIYGQALFKYLPKRYLIVSKDDILIIVITVIILGGMILTFFFPGGESRHGVGNTGSGDTPIIAQAGLKNYLSLPREDNL